MVTVETFFKPTELERNSFLWSMARLIIAAVALFIGGVPPVYYVVRTPALWGLVGSLLKLCWVISGLASAYLAYQWNARGRKVFGGTHRKDVVAFWVMVVSGFNLGVAGLLGTNVGMTLSSNRLLFIIVGALYLWAGWHLWQRFENYGRRLF